jgi:hypothetical protein
MRTTNKYEICLCVSFDIVNQIFNYGIFVLKYTYIISLYKIYNGL